jgi:hypothetical protein
MTLVKESPVPLTRSPGLVFHGVSFNPSDHSVRTFDLAGLDAELRDADVFSWIDIQAPDIAPMNEVLRLIDIDLLLVSHFDRPEVIVEQLNSFQPNFITGYTSALETITRELQAGRLKFRRDLEQMTNISEPLPEAIAQRVEKAFGVHITNVYSMAECMALTCGCQATHGSHLNDELAFLEVVERLKAPVHRGESQVGDLVQLAERAEDRQPHVVRRHPRAAPGPYRLFHLLGQDRELVLGHRAALAGAAHAAHDLVPGKGLGGAAALAHHQDHRFLCREPPAALRAGTAAADRGAVVGGPAVDDAAVRMPAERAEHAITSRRPKQRVNLCSTTCGRTTAV